MRLYATFTPFRKGRAFIILRSAVTGLSEARRPYGQAGRRMYLSFRFYRRVFLGGEPPPAGRLARVRFRHFPSGRLPRRCHLPARSITGPLWLKTVTCGLFLRCFTPPRRAPSGEGFTSTWFLMPLRSPYRFIPANTNPVGFRVEAYGVCRIFGYFNAIYKICTYAHMRICAHGNIYFFGADCFLSGGAIENLISSSLRQLYSTTSHKCVNTSTACLRVEMTRFSPPTASECV